MEHIEEMVASENACGLQLPQTVVDGLLLVGDDDLGDGAHHSEEMLEEEGVGEG